MVQEQNQFTQSLPQHHKAKVIMTVLAMLHPGYRPTVHIACILQPAGRQHVPNVGLFFWFILMHSSYLPGL